MEDSGTIQFIENAVPALEAGKYRIKVTQTVDLSGMPAVAPVTGPGGAIVTHEPTKSYSYEQIFHVLGARFGLGPADVQAVYPPANSQGQFDDTIPHIVLRRRTLPWERTLSASANAANPTPWFALLVFHEGELPAEPQIRGLGDIIAAPATDGDKKVKRPSIQLDEIENLDVPAAASTVQGNRQGPFQIDASTNQILLSREGADPVLITLAVNATPRKVDDIVTELNANAAFSAIATAQNKDGTLAFTAPGTTKVKLAGGTANATLGFISTQARTIDVPKALFTRIAPTIDELPLLAHVRHVSTDDKEPQGMLEDGWFSVMLANRLPQTGLNSVHLVSLEQWDGVLNGTVSLDGFDSVRLISLANWSFTQLPARGKFADLMKNMDVDLLAMPVAPGLASATSDEAQLLKGALGAGYVPLAYDMRQGEKTVAWYRGPLLPVVRTSQDRDPFPSAEAGMIYDDHTGMLDVSYAVAWQIGRLLALADIKFSDALTGWRQDGNTVLDQLIARTNQAAEFEQQKLLVTVGQIQNAPDSQKVKLALQLFQDLLTPGTFSRRLAKLVLDQFEASLSLQRAIVGSATGPFTIAEGQTFSIGLPDGTAVSVQLTPAGRRTTDQIITSLNADPGFAAVAQAARARDIDGAVAVYSLDPASFIKVLEANANTVLGFVTGSVSPSRAIVGTVGEPFTITRDANDKLAVSIDGGATVTVTLAAGASRTAKDISDSLNHDAAFAAQAHAQPGGEGLKRIAVSAADPGASVLIGAGTANAVLGFTAGSLVPAAAPVLVKSAPNTKNRLFRSTAALLQKLNTGDIKLSGLDAALAIRDQLLGAS